jgi:16S rRNA (guanine527-N7)-methyltransferase
VLAKRSQKSGVRIQNGKKDRSFHDLLEGLLRAVASGLALELSSRQIEQLATHFALLLRWNEKINLTSVRKPEEIATRHFEESLFLATLLPPPAGLLVDIGSGAGFPGLPLKIVWPSAKTVLLEPNNKKATFLKEVIRACGLKEITVRTERLEQAMAEDLAGQASLVTMRAVAATPELLRDVRSLLMPGGRAALFVSDRDAAELAKHPAFQWEPPAAIPHSDRRVILLGRS